MGSRPHATTHEFLVEVRWRLPDSMPQQERAGILEEEGVAGRELVAAGIIRRIWRLPGRTANVGIWAAPSATELHRYISSLPLFPWAEVTVTALAAHPLEDEPRS